MVEKKKKLKNKKTIAKPKSIPFSDKKIIGLVEKVKITGSKGTVETEALLDTGATYSSVDLKIAARAGLGPITRTMKVKSQTEPRGYARRAVVKGKITLRGITKNVSFTLADREVQSYPVLVGRNVIHSDFVIDVEKTHSTHKIEDSKAKK